MSLSLEHPEKLALVARALSSPLRLSILHQLSKKAMNVNELSIALKTPMSTAALAVRELEKAELIVTENLPGVRGMMKLSSRAVDTLSINLAPPVRVRRGSIDSQLPVGAYSLAEGIAPACGLVGLQGVIGAEDDVRSFYLPQRLDAQLVWFKQGFVEYQFAVPQREFITIDWLELSFESCSDAPMHRDPWKSDIFVEINGQRLGTWTSPADNGNRRGANNPGWWPANNTQYGYLKTWRVDEKGTRLDQDVIGDITLKDLALPVQPFIRVRIGVDPEATHVGGINLFGDKFGDFSQGILLRLGYRQDKSVVE